MRTTSLTRVGVAVAVAAGCGSGSGNAAPSSPGEPAVVVSVAPISHSVAPVSGLAPATSLPPVKARLEACVPELRDARVLDTGRSDAARELYQAALAAERAGDLDTARKSYYKIVQDWPSSKYMPLAFLGFGEMFAQEADSDESKREPARQSYLETMKYPPPDNVVYAYCAYRLAVTESKMAPEYAQRALVDYKRAWMGALSYPAASCAAAIQKAAGQGMADIYTVVGRAARASDFFRGMGEQEQGGELLAELVERYLQKGQTDEAVLVARDALQRQSMPALCEVARAALRQDKSGSQLRSELESLCSAKCP
jgi:hypothetical protein